MSRRIYISADYSESNGDRQVVQELKRWTKDNRYSLEFIDMAEVSSGSVSEDSDCRICDLKEEFNRQINSSSAVICIVGDQTANRTAGSACMRNKYEPYRCKCTPYKQNVNGLQPCNRFSVSNSNINNDINCVNDYSYLKHEFLQAQKKSKQIIVLYNSTRYEYCWLPSYLSDYVTKAFPFWVFDEKGNRIGNYSRIKSIL